MITCVLTCICNNKRLSCDFQVVNHFAKKPYETRPEIVQYYPAHEETTQLMDELRNYGLFRDETKDIKDMILKMRKLRGKEKTPWTAAAAKEKRGTLIHELTCT